MNGDGTPKKIKVNDIFWQVQSYWSHYTIKWDNNADFKLVKLPNSPQNHTVREKSMRHPIDLNMDWRFLAS